jgi:flavin-dependent thymidylate synthase
MTTRNSVIFEGCYGSDETHARSAWTSTNRRELSEERKQRIPSLLLQLAQDGHHSPFEKSALHFTVTCDIVTHYQLLKHRIGVSINAESARYKELEDKHYLPPDWPSGLSYLLGHNVGKLTALYHSTIEALQSEGFSRKRAKESARFFLPTAKQLEMDIQFNWRSFMHFCDLRFSVGAQLEIMHIAGEMLTLVACDERFKDSLRAFGYFPGSLPLRCMNYEKCKTTVAVELDAGGWWLPPSEWLRQRWGPSPGVRMVCSRACAEAYTPHYATEACAGR